MGNALLAQLPKSSVPGNDRQSEPMNSCAALPNGQTKRLEFLDTIRGLAALAVLLSHSGALGWPPSVARVLAMPFINIPFNGKEAVAMFFVLSGFVLSRPYFVSNEGQAVRKLYLPTFYLRRITRIWLPWLFAFCLSAFAQAFFFRKWVTTPPLTDWFDKTWHAPLTVMNFLRQCLFLEHRVSVQLLPQDWSLGVELKASVLLPLFVLLCVARSFRTLLAVSVGLLILFPTGPYYVIFVFGVLLAYYGPRLVAWLQPKPVLVKIGLLFLGLVLYETHHLGMDVLNHHEWEKCFWIITALGCVLIILTTLASQRIQNALHLAPMLFLGRISYSVYLLQFIVVMCVLPAWIHFLNGVGIQNPILLFFLTLLASVSVTMAISTLSYACVEKPCINLGRALSTKWQTKFLRQS
ncbi:MAG TPA: acyltransferase [Verrucomicrobiae bacterium]|jgi:peptidoglycan/LPS O-acetylase OafA/YrhL|nr:acyltransferase [Verrucomicrobiae bacterium]